MTRRSRSSRTTSRVRIKGLERVLFIFGATLFVVGLGGAMDILAMPDSTAVLLLALGGGLQLAVNLILIF